ncbi:unnamed protein product [Pseudo-nitzschia multistriata]|uniref:Uncharacterized protein n=1 Tax=Pseudo-nitzschia multistriata TaxID=183589 RepID=A0A448ZSR1_9STRA|nr:unnamed protein product [Pseudo-nitzschia multistriata]
MKNSHALRRKTAPSVWYRMLVSMAMLIVLASFTGNNGGLLVSAEMEASWTPNEEGGPAMPLSMHQRQQLVQLQQAIQNSPDPNGTLQQVAQSNNMSPNELYQMIEKNAQDLQQDPALLSELQQFAQSGGRMGNSLPKMVVKFIAGLGVAMRQTAQQNPRAFTTSLMAALLIFYTLLAIPRTGLQISSGRSILTLSSGPTTVFSPPDRYLHKMIGKVDSMVASPKLSIKTMKKDWDDLLKPLTRELVSDYGAKDNEEDTDDLNDPYGRVETHSLGRKNELKQAVTAQFMLGPDQFLTDFPLGDTLEEIAAERENIIDMLYANAAGLLTERNLVEFSDATSKARDRLRAVCGDGKKDRDSSLSSKDFGVIVVPGLGKLGRYGLMYWKVTSETSQKSSSAVSSQTLTLTTLKGKGFFDGQIHFDVRKIPHLDGMLLVQVSLAVPRGGRKLQQKRAEALVENMARSLVRSVSRRTRQRLARQSQGKRFKDTGSRRADDRRKERFERERLLEEMATDRRRRWQKTNPDAGRYRPSGHRMRSPNNC